MAETGTPPRRKPRFRERYALREAEAAPVQRPTPPPPPRARAAAEIPSTLPSPRITGEIALYAAVVILAFVLRIWDVGSRAMHGDESVHAWMAWHLFIGQGYQYDPVYHGPLQFPVTAFFFFLFGDSNTSGRLMAVLFGTALVVLPYYFRPYIGRTAALIAAIFMAISPEFVYDSRLERDDIFTAFFAMTLAIAIWGYLRTRRARYVYLGAASAALSLAAMENTYITFFVFGGYILLVIGSEALARSGAGAGIVRTWRAIGTGDRIGWIPLALFAALVLAAMVITIVTGNHVLVPALLGLALVALVVRQAMIDVLTSGQQTYLRALRSITRTQWLNAATIIIAILFLLFSTFGTNLRGIWDASQPLLNSGTACPGNSYFLNPCRKDLVGGLFYWLSQHKVARGGQPWFYYSFLFGLYEQIAVILGLAGTVYFLRRPRPFTTFLIFWAVLMFGVYSWAGEKFPWLMLHPLLPFTLLAAAFTAEIIRKAGTVRYLALAGIALLTLLELHSMYEVNFVNGADPVEMMVYVQSAPDTPVVAHRIETLSNKVTNGDSMNVTIDSAETWPFAWYLRHLTNAAYPGYPQLLDKPFSTNPVIIVDAADQPGLLPKLHGRYQGHRYILRWWFPENYKTLSWSRFGREAVNPGYWRVVWDWLTVRRPFGPKGHLDFYLYVKKGIASPY